jgi:hypothetical protein
MVGRGTVTVRLTFTVAVPVEGEVPVTVIVPLYVPAESPVGLTETVKLLGAVPLAGETTSHPDGVLAAVAVKFPVLAFETVTGTACVLGAEPPA